MPLGPDQAAVRLGVRRTDFDQVVRLGWLYPVASVDVDYKRHGGVTTVPLYDARDVALLEVVRPSVDWRAVRTVAAGRRSPLAALDPIAPGGDRVFLAEGANGPVPGAFRRRSDAPNSPAASSAMSASSSVDQPDNTSSPAG
ncbi:hypothetical protein ABZ934_31540 [Streptomyces sp. NPDC046557]|uniref:hypothetical protein n=1 Tax=Streptomyces sp. NPDC046557 TaxID=3155372 RepID=UPI00340EB54D